MVETGTKEAHDERPEDPTSALERTCLGLLEQGNKLAEEKPLDAQRKCVEATIRLLGVTSEWDGLARIKAMLALLQANIQAYLGSPDKDSLYDLYRAAIRIADMCPQDDPLSPLPYGLRARRAYAAVLAFYGDHDDAESYLDTVLEGVTRQQDEGFWLQATVQMAEVYWQQGDVLKAYNMLEAALCYQEGDLAVCKDYVAGLVLMSRLCWHTGRGPQGRSYSGLAVREALRLDPDREQAFTRRVIRLTNPFGSCRFRDTPGVLRASLGFKVYGRMLGDARCPRL
jgi:tetratricopeptide (TPR) repeat protein